MTDAKHPGGATQALPLQVGSLNQFGGDLTTFLFAVQHPVAAAVLAFIGLGATSILTVLDNINALATLTMTRFNNHETKYTNQLKIYTIKRIKKLSDYAVSVHAARLPMEGD